MQQFQCDLKLTPKTEEQLARDDFIFHLNSIWRCISKVMLKFQNIHNKKEEKEIKQKLYHTLIKLQLIPIQWKVSDIGKIVLKGRELGMGPIHQIQVIGMSQFQQLQVVKRAKQQGKVLSYKVICCQMKEPKQLVLAIDIL